MKFSLISVLILGLIFPLFADENLSLDAELGLDNDEAIDELDDMDVEYAEAPGIRSRVIGDAFLVTASLGFSKTSSSYIDNAYASWGVPFLVDIGYRLPKAYELSALGETALSFGVNAGFVQVLWGEKAKGNADTKDDLLVLSVPVNIYAKAHFEYVNFQLGLGLHKWFHECTEITPGLPNTEKDVSGTNFMVQWGLTHEYALSRTLNVELGVKMYYLLYPSQEYPSDFNGYDYPVYMLTVGLNWIL